MTNMTCTCDLDPHTPFDPQCPMHGRHTSYDDHQASLVRRPCSLCQTIQFTRSAVDPYVCLRCMQEGRDE